MKLRANKNTTVIGATRTINHWNNAADAFHTLEQYRALSLDLKSTVNTTIRNIGDKTMIT